MFILIPLSGKQIAPPITGAGEENCSALTTALIVAYLSFSYLSVSVKKLELTFVDIFLSLAIFYFAAILFGSETNLDFVALDNLFH